MWALSVSRRQAARNSRLKVCVPAMPEMRLDDHVNTLYVMEYNVVGTLAR
jgi:hypothetical protein